MVPGGFGDDGLVGGTSGSLLTMTTHDGCAGYRPRRLKTRMCRLRQGPPCLCILDGFRQKAAGGFAQRLAGCWTKVWISPQWLADESVFSFSLNCSSCNSTAPSLTRSQPKLRQIISLHERDDLLKKSPLRICQVCGRVTLFLAQVPVTSRIDENWTLVETVLPMQTWRHESRRLFL